MGLIATQHSLTEYQTRPSVLTRLSRNKEIMLTLTASQTMLHMYDSLYGWTRLQSPFYVDDVSGQEEEYISVDKQTLNVRLLRGVDYESGKSLNFTYMSCSATINAIDINDHGPVIYVRGKQPTKVEYLLVHDIIKVNM